MSTEFIPTFDIYNSLSLFKIMKPQFADIKTFIFFPIAFAFLFIYSCNSELQKAPGAVEETITTEETETSDTENIFYSIPSPMELGQLLKRAGATYNNELLNPADRASLYIGTSSKALNMGVYIADLSYAAVSNQMQESMIYVNSSRILSEDLGLKSFSPEMMLEIEKNIDKKDELMKLVSEAYQSSNEKLSENDREMVSKLAISGAWIEGIYLGTQVAKTTTDNSGIVKMVAEQRTTLDNLISQMEIYKSNIVVKSLVNDLKEIKTIYDETPVEEATAEVKTENGSNIITIGGTSGFSLSEDQFLRITGKVEKIRISIVKI